MRIERYYASVKEDVSPLSPDALTLLNSQDYIGFFKSCGPSFIRGIRRAQEVTSFLIFESTDTEKSSEYAYNVQVSSWHWNRKYSASGQSNSKYNAESKSLRIVVKGWGLGLTQDGSETLIATTVQEFNQVMKFAFRTMTTSTDSIHIGMVYGMEVAPWVESTTFQVAVGVGEEDITVPVTYSLIPQSYRIADNEDKVFVEAERTLFTCKEPSYHIDKFGYCCAIDQLYNYDTEEYDLSNPTERICRPLRQLERTMIKDNLIANAEFVARIDAALRMRMVQLSTLERCISAIRAIPERYDAYVLKSQDTVKVGGVIDPNFSVWEMKMALDPFNDFSMVNQVSQELDEFLDMFYQPCLAALFGSNVGNSPDTDPKFFMAYPWHVHDECSKLSCLGTSMRWDRREGGGCVPGIMNGGGAIGYDWNDSECSKTVDLTGKQVCKYDSEDLWAFHFKTTTCWRATVGGANINYYMDTFCLPEITNQVIDEVIINEMKTAKETHCDVNPYSNEPSTIPSSMPSAEPSDPVPSKFPSSLPSDIPSRFPSQFPSDIPSQHPSEFPSLIPSQHPSNEPSQHPSDLPSDRPSETPSQLPSKKPSQFPSIEPSQSPSDLPSNEPSEFPSLIPSEFPSQFPSNEPSEHPSDKPSQHPSELPSLEPSQHPSELPSAVPSRIPSVVPSDPPSLTPSQNPSREPSDSPSKSPKPSQEPSQVPSQEPSDQPNPSR